MQDENISPLREFFHSKYVWIFWAIDIIAIIAVIAVIAHQSAKVSTIYFNVVPVDATISVNGDTHYANGQYEIAPGKYNVSISHDGLETKTLSVDLESHDYSTVNIFLSGSDKNFDFYKLKDNYESFKKLKTIASAEYNITTDNDASAQQFIVDYEHTLSFLDALPIKGFVYAGSRASMPTGGFTMVKGQNNKACTESACLLIRYHGIGYKKEVMNKIKKAGYNPDDYQIVYERYVDGE